MNPAGRRPLALATAILPLLLASLTARADETAADATGTATGTADPGDTLAVDLPDLVVSAAAAAPVRVGRTRLDAPRLAVADAASVADLGGLLPSTRVAVNSRGDVHPMVRGAPERHVQTFLDGIPLNVPWDERVDLATVPALGVGAVAGRRGPASLLDGPGAIAGSVRLLPPAPVGRAPRTALRVAWDGGRDGLGEAELRHQRRAGAWQLLGAGALATRDAWRLPGGEARFNSDRRQWSALLRGSRPVGSAGRLSLLATAFTAEKGAPPEQHLGDAARFWRYPVRERLLLGASLDVPLGRDRAWDLGAMAAVDLYHQEIDPRGPDGWGAPLLPGDPYEKSWDRTAHARLRLTRWLGDHAAVAVQTAARYTHHRESQAAGEPLFDYAQWLVSSAASGQVQLAGGWTVDAAVGWDHASVPQAGPREPSPLDAALAANLRVVRDLGRGWAAHAALGRRSRYPSLREAYSGALGRFVVNPQLGPERQDQLELGVSLDRGRWQLAATAFAGRLTDGIEREAIDAGTFRRVNRGEIEVPGLELVGAWWPRPHLTARLQHTVMDATVTHAGAERPAEDRPDYLSRAELAWQPDRGPGALVAARAIGPRWSADGTAPSGLRELPSGILWDLRLSWRTGGPPLLAGNGGPPPVAEVFLRLDNLLDQRLDHQTGLPAPGRTVRGGCQVVF